MSAQVEAPTPEQIRSACNVLGWDAPRPVQAEILDPLFAGRDVVAVIPTSGGKSGLYQIPALARDGLVLVISPLVALMADQVGRLRAHGVNAHMLNSHCSAREKRVAMDAIQSGKAKLLYVSPERLQGVSRAFFGNAHLQLVAIDEAHCISEWGHDFRPAYMRVGRNLARLGNVQKLALTATATHAVVDEIAKVLQIDADAARIVKSPDRPNLMYGIVGSKVSVPRLVQRAGTPCLVYGSTRKSVEDAAVKLTRSGFQAAHYHAGMKGDDRHRVQEAFISGDLEVVVATCAFGMGIDHPGIRSVVHLEMPTSLEAYTQEVGRAGRSGGASIAICRATVDTLGVAKQLAAVSWPEPRTVRMFWRRLKRLFRSRTGKWEGEGRIQLTNEEIAGRMSWDAREVGSCLRILHDCGAIRRVPYQDRPVRVILLSGADRLTGVRQQRVIARLREHAESTSDMDTVDGDDNNGEVLGSVAFFRNVIGLDRSYARELSVRNAIRYFWVDKCQVIEQLVEGDAPLDEEQINRIRRRSLDRIKVAERYMRHRGCRRAYLLEYFGDDSGGQSVGRCCDRCRPPDATP